VLLLVAFLFTLYILNIGGNLSGESGYSIAWFHGVRLFSEPLFLLVVGLALPNPVKTYHWAVRSVVATAVVVTVVGGVQQVLGVQWLIVNGYRYGKQVREIGGHLRSFGTLDEPFSYATMLLLAIAVVLLRGRLRPSSYALVSLLSVGLVFSFVRTAALIMLADGVEASVRSLASRDEPSIRSMVARIVAERMEDGLGLPIGVARPPALDGYSEEVAARLTVPYGLALDS